MKICSMPFGSGQNSVAVPTQTYVHLQRQHHWHIYIYIYSESNSKNSGMLQSNPSRNPSFLVRLSLATEQRQTPLPTEEVKAVLRVSLGSYMRACGPATDALLQSKRSHMQNKRLIEHTRPPSRLS